MRSAWYPARIWSRVGIRSAPGCQVSRTCALVQSGGDPLDACGQVAFDLEVPDTDDRPASLRELSVDAFVSRPAARDLLVPELASLPPIVVGVAVPERAVHEPRDAPADPRDVGPADDFPRVTAPAPHSCSPK